MLERESRPMTNVPLMTAAMSDEQKAVFYSQFASYEKDEVAGVLLALFLGSFGAHQFYLGRTGAGIVYLLFSWTGIPAILGVIECFFMPSRVQRYNLERAAILAASIRGVAPGLMMQPVYARACAVCGTPIAPGVRFCAACGTPVA